MIGVPGAAAEAAAIHAAFAEPVRYTGAGLANASLPAVASDIPGLTFEGGGATVRERRYELRKADLAERPGKGDVIVECDGDGPAWSVIDVTDRADVGAWEVAVEAIVR